MRFKTEKPESEEDLKYLPDLSTVYVGDKFYMILKYIGQQGKYLKKMHSWNENMQFFFNLKTVKERRTPHWTNGT